eukprot:1137565-Pelagomonas_calceolata.AAC.1
MFWDSMVAQTFLSSPGCTISRPVVAVLSYTCSKPHGNVKEKVPCMCLGAQKRTDKERWGMLDVFGQHPSNQMHPLLCSCGETPFGKWGQLVFGLGRDNTNLSLALCSLTRIAARGIIS